MAHDQCLSDMGTNGIPLKKEIIIIQRLMIQFLMQNDRQLYEFHDTSIAILPDYLAVCQQCVLATSRPSNQGVE